MSLHQQWLMQQYYNTIQQTYIYLLYVQYNKQIKMNAKNEIYITTSQKSTSMLSQQYYPRELSAETFENVSLNNLKKKNKLTDKSIEIMESRIKYLKNKQIKEGKSITHIHRKQIELELIHNRVKQQKQRQEEILKKQQQQIEERNEFNRVLREHMENNRQIVEILNRERQKDKRKKYRSQKQEIKRSISFSKNSHIEQNVQRVNRIKIERMISQRSKKLHYLEKLDYFRKDNEDIINMEITKRETHENKLQQLQKKEMELLEKYTLSKKFKMRCQEEYLMAKDKYHSFYDNMVAPSKKSLMSNYSSNDQKCNIFIS